MFKRKNKRINESALTKKIVRTIMPILERSLNEYSSVEWNDIADRFYSMSNRTSGDYSRDRADKARENELHTEYTDTLEEYDTLQFGKRKFIIGRYIPTNTPVIIYLKDAKQAAIVRVYKDELRDIPNREIAQDIAALYDRKPIAKDNVSSIAIALERNYANARQLTNAINRAFGSHVNYHYFYGQPKPKQDKEAATLTEEAYDYVGGFNTQSYKVRIAKINTNSKGYSIYYVLIGNEEMSFIMTVYKWMKDIEVRGQGKPGPIYRKIERQGFADGIVQPTKKSSNIVNIYDFFMSLSPRTQRVLTNALSKRLDDARFTIDDIERGYLNKDNAIPVHSDDETIDVPSGNDNANYDENIDNVENPSSDEDDVQSFMDV